MNGPLKQIEPQNCIEIESLLHHRGIHSFPDYSRVKRPFERNFMLFAVENGLPLNRQNQHEVTLEYSKCCLTIKTFTTNTRGI